MKRSAIRPGAVLATLFVAFVFFGAVRSDGADGFASCAGAFPGDDVDRAPKRTHPPGPVMADVVCGTGCSLPAVRRPR